MSARRWVGPSIILLIIVCIGLLLLLADCDGPSADATEIPGTYRSNQSMYVFDLTLAEDSTYEETWIFKDNYETWAYGEWHNRGQWSFKRAKGKSMVALEHAMTGNASVPPVLRQAALKAVRTSSSKGDGIKLLFAHADWNEEFVKESP